MEHSKEHSKPTFEVTCPCCQARLRVDAEVRGVVSHEPPPKQAKVKDLAEATRALHEKESKRGEQFEKSFETERERGKLLQRKFDEAFEKAKDQPISRPLRDFDLD